MKKLYYLVVLVLILGLVLTGCLLSNVGQVPTSEQSGIVYLTKGPSSGLVGWWRFDGDALDSSGNSNHGTVYGASWVDGKFGNALSFDGVDDYVDFGLDTSLELTDEFTIELWVKRTDKTTFERFLSHSINNTTYAYEVGVDYMKPDEWRLRLNSDDVTLQVAMKGQAGEWIHVAFVYDNSLTSDNMKIYENGALVAKRDYNKSLTNHGKLRTNRHLKNDGWLKSPIDEVRIWNTALTADQLILYDDFSGLLAPYKEPPKAFKIGSSIPLKWQYLDLFGTAVDSSTADPSVEIKWASNGNTLVEGEPIEVHDPGSSGYQYDSETDTWQFNWQTKDCAAGTYNIWIINNWTGQTFGPFLIRLR